MPRRTVRVRRAAALFLLIGLSTTPVAASAVAAVPGRPAAAVTLDGAAVDRLVGDYVRRTGLPGAVVAVTRGDRVVRVAGYGHTADGTPMDASTPVPVASLSKAMTAVAVLQLVHTGRIGLDRPVAAQLPGFGTADPRSSSVTVRQLLNQTSGITDDTYRSLSAPQPADLAGAVAALRDTRLGADPGAGYHYQNVNYAIAARLVEVVSGRPFAQYMTDDVFVPLGMTRTYTVDTTDEMPGRARGFVRAYGHTVGVDEPRVFTQGGFGVVTTAEDLARWLRFQGRAGGPSVLSGADLDLMQYPPAGSEYAMGWWTDRGALEHTGELFTHNADAKLLPDSGTGIAVVTNTGTVSGDDAAVLGAGLTGLARGDGTDADSPFTLGADPVLAVLTVVVAGLGVLGVWRAGRWARRTAHRPARRAAGLAAAVVPAVLLTLACDVVVPWPSGTVTAGQAVLMWPALAVAWVVTASASAAVLLARLRGVLRAQAVSGPDR